MINRNEKGFTLVELMVAMVIGLILMAGVYALYRNTQETYISQEKVVESQQNTRILLDELTREFRLAGYLSDCSAPAYASPTEFQFEADTDFDGTSERVYYKYIDDSSDPDYQTLFRATDTDSGNCTQMSSPDFVAVAQNIESVNFDFYDTNNGFIDSGGGALNATQLTDVRRATIRVKDEVIDPATNKSHVISMISDVRFRNEGLADTGGCAIPGAVSGFSVSDIQVCNRVKATWTKNDSSDQVTTYRLYTRLSGQATWLSIDDAGDVNTYTKSTGLVDGTTYEFAIAAKSDCGVGPLSSVVSVALNDAVAPDAATGLTASAATAGNTVDLSWTASISRDSGGNPVTPDDISGYNVWRSDDGGTSWFGPINGALLTATNFTDTVPVACEVYYYKVQTADTCGNMSAFSASIGGDGPPPPTDPDTSPEEAVAPDDPGGFVAVAGGKHGGVNNYRVGLSWSFPADDDAEGVRVLYNKQNGACGAGDYPTNPGGNTHLADETGDPSSTFSQNYDVFSNNKYYCFTAFAYDHCGNYSAGSAATSQAKTCGDDPAGAPLAIDLNSLDVDRDQFKSPATIGISDVANQERGRVSLTWTTTQDTTNTPDIVGFNVYRNPSVDDYGKSTSYNSKTFYALADAPTFFPSGYTPQFTDSLNDSRNTCISWGPDGTADTAVSGDDLADASGINAGPDKVCDSVLNDTPVGVVDDLVPTSGVAIGLVQDPSKTRKLLPGEIYEFVVTVTDCLEQDSAVNESIFVAPGKLTRNKTIDVTTDGTKAKQNNIVAFSVRNTSASDMTIRAGTDPMTITWTDGNARLTKVQLGGTTLWQDASAAPTTTSGTALTLTASKTISAAAWDEPMLLTFKKSDGNTNIDMRGNTLTVNLSFRNDLAQSQGTSEYESTVTHQFSLTASSGAVLSDTRQSPPQDPDDASLPAPAESSLDPAVPLGWLVSSASDVVIRTIATPQSGSNVSSVTLNYYEDGSYLSAAPDPSVTPYTPLVMTALGGNVYEVTIPASPGKRIWYFVEAVDNKGRVTTDPNQSETVFISYTYDHKRLIIDPLNYSWLCTVPPDQVLVDGTVTDQSGTVVPGVSLDIEVNGTPSAGLLPDLQTVVTGADGKFDFTSVQDFDVGTATINITATEADHSDLTCTLNLPWAPCLPAPTTCE